ncbi:hypothetical protein [Pseudomonas indica]|uniref:hypothetical protein n=1 Tax=Pseudomonas indica TaxID=137658 RepID=UPI0023F7C1C2|nr:hypothetical protein [Pseudomonas indica]MBU3056891.1 hypothetical protein [Pseudomonas indica]
MGVKKLYGMADVKSAIDMANNHYYRTFLRVRSDVSNEDFGQLRVRVPRDASNNPIDPMAWQGRGSDVGHAFRHVQETATAGKSTYENEQEMLRCTCDALNSHTGQQKLGDLDNANPSGDEHGMGVNRKIVAPLRICSYGYPTGSTVKKRIRSVVVEVMKLGSDTLWIHSTYPNRFET